MAKKRMSNKGTHQNISTGGAIRDSRGRITSMSPIIIKGEEAVNELLAKYGGVPLNQVGDMKSVDLINDSFDNRPRSNIVKWMMEKSNKTVDDLAVCLGCTTTFINNKLHRGTFSFDDLIMIAYICGFFITITDNNPDEEVRCTYQIDVKDYFRNYNEDALEQLFAYEERVRKQQKAEYDELKAKLEKMKEEYGFED